MFAKIHQTANGKVLACCDRELLGKTLEGNEIVFKVSESFYKDRLVDEKELGQMFGESANINLVGEKSVSVALKKGFLSEKNIIKIGEIPHAQIYRI